MILAAPRFRSGLLLCLRCIHLQLPARLYPNSFHRFNAGFQLPVPPREQLVCQETLHRFCRHQRRHQRGWYIMAPILSFIILDRAGVLPWWSLGRDSLHRDSCRAAYARSPDLGLKPDGICRQKDIRTAAAGEVHYTVQQALRTELSGCAPQSHPQAGATAAADNPPGGPSCLERIGEALCVPGEPAGFMSSLQRGGGWWGNRMNRRLMSLQIYLPSGFLLYWDRYA